MEYTCIKKPTPVITKVNKMESVSINKEKSAWKSPTCIHENRGAVRACGWESCEANSIRATIKEANMLPGAKKVVIVLDKLLPDSAMMRKLTNGNNGIRYINCSTLFFNF